MKKLFLLIFAIVGLACMAMTADQGRPGSQAWKVDNSGGSVPTNYPTIQVIANVSPTAQVNVNDVVGNGAWCGYLQSLGMNCQGTPYAFQTSTATPTWTATAIISETTTLTATPTITPTPPNLKVNYQAVTISDIGSASVTLSLPCTFENTQWEAGSFTGIPAAGATVMFTMPGNPALGSSAQQVTSSSFTQKLTQPVYQEVFTWLATATPSPTAYFIFYQNNWNHSQ